MDKVVINQLPVEKLRGRRVFVRIDADAELAPSGMLVDESKLCSSLPTLEYLRGVGARVVIGASLGKPVIDQPDPPFVALIAGARLEEKLPILENLLPRLNRLFIGGALAFTFLKAKWREIGSAPVDKALLPLV